MLREELDDDDAPAQCDGIDGRAIQRHATKVGNCTTNGYFWVFHGGLTESEYTLTVEDLESQTSWSYHNPPYALTSGADTTALTGPP